MVLRLKDGRKELYQWDVGVVADVTDENINEVHFSNLRYGVSFNVEVKNLTVNIPPEVLQNGADVFCWAFVRQENGGYTKKEQVFNVEKRPRPADYIYEPTEVLTWEALKQQIENVEKGTIKTVEEVNLATAQDGLYLTSNLHYPTEEGLVEVIMSDCPSLLIITSERYLPKRFIWFKPNEICEGYTTSYKTVILPNEISQDNPRQIVSAKAVYDYVNKVSSGGIAELPEGDNSIADLATGIYKVNGADGSSTLWLDDAMWLGIVDGVVTVDNPLDAVEITWTAIGLETSWTPVYYTGTTTWNTEGEHWECLSYGEVENTNNKKNHLNEPNNFTYPTTQAVVDYVDKVIGDIDNGTY